jgi:DNA-binding MarR family transcriptional regulator
MQATELDRTLHEPSRLLISYLLYAVESAEFGELLRDSRLTKGNLSSHLAKLEAAAYIEAEKSFRGRVPHTELKLTPQGRAAFEQYRSQLRALVESLDRVRDPRFADEWGV